MQLSIKNVHLFETLINKFKFELHHCTKNYIMLNKWIVNTKNMLPKYAHHFIGVGCVLINSNNQILLVQELTGPTSKLKTWKLPGGFVETTELLAQAGIIFF